MRDFFDDVNGFIKCRKCNDYYSDHLGVLKKHLKTKAHGKLNINEYYKKYVF